MKQEEKMGVSKKTKGKQLTDKQKNLVIRHQNIIYSFFREHNIVYNKKNEEIKDLKSDMTEALCYAALTYDDTKNIKFTTYAWTCIENAWLNRIKAQNRLKRIPDDKLCSLNASVDGYEDDNENECEEYGNLFPSVNNTEEEALCNLVFDECIKKLNDRELLVLQLYMQKNTIEQIAEKLKCTESYVYKVKTKFVKMFKSC